MVQIFSHEDDDMSAPTTTTTAVTQEAGEIRNDTSEKAPWYRGSSFTCIPCQRSFNAQVGGRRGSSHGHRSGDW